MFLGMWSPLQGRDGCSLVSGALFRVVMCDPWCGDVFFRCVLMFLVVLLPVPYMVRVGVP